MLVTIALMGVVLSALATITAQWVPNWHRGFARVQRNEMLDIALSRLVADIGAAEFVTANRKATKPLFDGAELSVTFVRSALGPNTRPGLEVVRISQAADRLGPVLVRVASAVRTDRSRRAPVTADGFHRSGRVVARALSSVLCLCGSRWHLAGQVAGRKRNAHERAFRRS